jgi:hypothetical protein
MTQPEPTVGTPPLDFDDTRVVDVTLHRVATRDTVMDDQFNVWFADDSVEHCTVPHNPRGSVAEWVEHHVFSTAPESRFQSLTPESDRIDAGADAPVIGQLHVRDDTVVGLALDVDALVGVETAGDHLLAARLGPSEEDDADEDLATDGGNAHASGVNSIVREQYRTARENGTLDPDLAERFDGGER